MTIDIYRNKFTWLFNFRKEDGMIAIIDYDAGNLKSVEKAFHYLGQETLITRDYKELLKADKVILPGVGSFGEAMAKLKSFDLIQPIHEIVQKNIPFLGICLGLQLLYKGSEESQGIEGLSILEGDIKRIPQGKGIKIPHIGWNSLTMRQDAKLFQGIEKDSYVYFVHSYYLQSKKAEEVAATTYYNATIHASVEKENVFGCQFHPEKSGTVGLTILNNFATY